MPALLALIAVVLFAIAALGGHLGSINVVDLGLAFFAAAFLLSVLGIGSFTVGRRA